MNLIEFPPEVDTFTISNTYSKSILSPGEVVWWKGIRNLMKANTTVTTTIIILNHSFMVSIDFNGMKP